MLSRYDVYVCVILISHSMFFQGIYETVHVSYAWIILLCYVRVLIGFIVELIEIFVCVYTGELVRWLFQVVYSNFSLLAQGQASGRL